MVSNRWQVSNRRLASQWPGNYYSTKRIFSIAFHSIFFNHQSFYLELYNSEKIAIK